MAMKTKSIEVKVDERLAEYPPSRRRVAKRCPSRGAISDKAVKAWHATSYSNGKKRVYVTFEEVKTVGA